MNPSSTYGNEYEASSSKDDKHYSGTNSQTPNSRSSKSVSRDKATTTSAEPSVEEKSFRPSVKEKPSPNSFSRLVDKDGSSKREAEEEPGSSRQTRDDLREAYGKKQDATRYRTHTYVQAPLFAQTPGSQQVTMMQSPAHANFRNPADSNDELVYLQLPPAERTWDQLERLAQEQKGLALQVDNAEAFLVVLRWLKEKNPGLISLSIDCAIGDDGAYALVEVCKPITSLMELRLQNTNIGPDGALALSHLIHPNSTLVVLGIIDNHIGPQGAQAISNALKSNEALKALDLENNGIGPEGARHLSEALKENATLEVLSVFDNKIGEQGAKYLAKALEKNSVLNELVAYDNNIGAVGAAYFAQALERNSSLKRLAIGKNDLGDDGAWALCEALKTNSTLADLCIDTNNIGIKSAKFLSEVIDKNTCLTTLVMGNNPLGSIAVMLICSALEKNNTLSILNLDNCQLDDTAAFCIMTVLERNSSVDLIQVFDNKFTFMRIADLNAYVPRLLCNTFKGVNESQYTNALAEEIRTGIPKEDAFRTKALLNNEPYDTCDNDVAPVPALAFPELPSSARHSKSFSQFFAEAAVETILPEEELATLERMRPFYLSGDASIEEVTAPHIREMALLKFLLDKRTSFENLRDAIEESGSGPKIAKGWFPYAIYNTSFSIDRRAKIKYLLTLNADPNEQHPLNGTAVHALIANEVFEDDVLFLIKQFLCCSHPIKLDAIDARGNSILMLATKVRSTTVAKFLVEQGADCTTCDKDKKTPLHCAAILGNVVLFDIIRTRNPELLHQKDNSNLSPLDYLVIPFARRETVAKTLLRSVDINPTRDEGSLQNYFLDIDWSPITRKQVPFESTREIANELLPLLKKKGVTACDNIDYGDQSLAFIKAQAERLTGKSLLSACMRQQASIRGAYLPTTSDYVPHPACSMLNQLMQTHKINIEFITRHKQHLPGFVDAVAILRVGVETATVKRVREVLPATLLMRHYEREGRQFFSVDHLQLAEHQQALERL